MSDDLYPTLDEIGVWFFDHQPIQVALDAWKVALAQHDAELRKEIAWEIRAMGSESWDGYTPDEVPGTVATRIATQDASLDEGESR